MRRSRVLDLQPTVIDVAWTFFGDHKTPRTCFVLLWNHPVRQLLKNFRIKLKQFINANAPAAAFPAGFSDSVRCGSRAWKYRPQQWDADASRRETPAPDNGQITPQKHSRGPTSIIYRLEPTRTPPPTIFYQIHVRTRTQCRRQVPVANTKTPCDTRSVCGE